MADDDKDMTNNRLAGLLSIENVVWLVGLSFAFGVGYNALASDNEAVTKKVIKIEVEQKALNNNVAMIQTDIAVIKNDQHHIKQRLERMFKILERDYPPH